MSHPCRRWSVSSSLHSWWSELAARWRQLWCSGRACAGCAEREPQLRSVFRPSLVFLEERLAPDNILGLPFGGAVVGNLGGGKLEQHEGGAGGARG
jgi:hypothetical protein